MITGFEKIVEERIQQAQKNGEFDNLQGSGKPLVFEDEGRVSGELSLAYKILKNADCLPPELELKKEMKLPAASGRGIKEDNINFIPSPYPSPQGEGTSDDPTASGWGI